MYGLCTLVCLQLVPLIYLLCLSMIKKGLFAVVSLRVIVGSLFSFDLWLMSY